MELGGPPRVPQITFAASSQPVGPESAGQKRLGASVLGPVVPRTGAPRPASLLPSWKRSGGLAGARRRDVASRGSRLDARLGWGCGGARRGRSRTAEGEE